MLLFVRKGLLPAVSGCAILSLASSIHGSSDSLERSNQSFESVQPLELTPKLSLQLKLHTFLLWSSVGFLMPAGVLLIRSVAAALSITNFENTFNNTHQQIGLALYGLSGSSRSSDSLDLTGACGSWCTGCRGWRCGIHKYRERTSRSIGLWTSLLATKVSAVALVNLLQGRWNHVMPQEVAAGDERQSEMETSC
ncbi:hypothetical protein VPH35_011340 [Triticum aestivum]